MATLINLLTNVSPARRLIMEYLTATDVATLCYTCPIKLTDWEKKMLLKPIRDLPEHKDWIKAEIGKGTKITIMSTHIPMWMMRVKKPSEYWTTTAQHAMVRVWIIAKMSIRERSTIRSRMVDKYVSMNSLACLMVTQDSEWYVDTFGYVDLVGYDDKVEASTISAPQHESTYAAFNEWRQLKADAMADTNLLENSVKPPGMFVPMNETSADVSDMIEFGYNACDSYAMSNWLLCTPSDRGLVEIMYTNYFPDLFDIVPAVMYWVPSSIVSAAQDGLRTWIIPLCETVPKTKYIDGTETTDSHRTRSDCDMLIRASFADSPITTWENTLAIEIGSL